MNPKTARRKRPKATTRRVTRLHAITAHRRLHRSPRKLLAAMRLEYADKLTAQREAFRNERRQARADRSARSDLDLLLPPTHPRGQHALHLLSEDLIP